MTAGRAAAGKTRRVLASSIFRALAHALPLHNHPERHGPSAATATCAAHCGQPVVLGEAHYTALRNVERVLDNGEIETLDSDELAYAHLGCWSGEPAAAGSVSSAPGQPGAGVVA